MEENGDGRAVAGRPPTCVMPALPLGREQASHSLPFG